MHKSYLLAPLGALIFFAGFFPIAKVSDQVSTEPPEFIGNLSLRPDLNYRSNVTKTVLIIIDALRLDFVTSTLMPYTSTLARPPKGCFNVVKTETPTVTLPRIKALIAGSIPQFIDLVLNLFGTDSLRDSLVHSVVKSGMRVVFYGDETWLRLFPDQFLRSEGTHSFFVRDFKEVDDNVTRNVEKELKRDDWEFMILHYLGLDHIGHVHGPRSPLVPPKLLEMDLIINLIETTLPTGSIMIITGDHGMRDSGGHGGSTYPETTVPFILTGIGCTDGTLAQTDIPANLAGLLGLTIPATSIGTVRSNLFDGFEPVRYLYTTRYNGLVLGQKDQTGLNTMDLFDLAERYHYLYLKGLNHTFSTMAGELYHNYSHKISQTLLQSSVRQNHIYLSTGLLLVINSILTVLNQSNHPNLLVYGTILLVPFLNLTYLIYLPLLTGVLMVNLIDLIRSGLNLMVHDQPWLLLLLFLTVQPLSFISSSYVEEEHQYWYHTTGTLLLLLTRFEPFGLVLFCCFRFLRGLNATGDQWGDQPDWSDWLSLNVVWYWAFFVVGLLFVLFWLNNAKLFGCFELTNVVVVVGIFLFKFCDSNPIFGQLLWLSILTHLMLFNNKIKTWVLICCLLFKPYNVVLIPFCVATSSFVQQHLTTSNNILFHIFLTNLLYFSQGHSNSLASLDISVGYVGLTGYNAPVVMLQVLLHTYALPVLCYSLVLSNGNVVRDEFWTVVLLNRLYSFVVVGVVTFIQRHHLFIWSVFAPKLFIETVHLLVLFFGYFFSEFLVSFSKKKTKFLNYLSKV